MYRMFVIVLAAVPVLPSPQNTAPAKEVAPEQSDLPATGALSQAPEVLLKRSHADPAVSYESRLSAGVPCGDGLCHPPETCDTCPLDCGECVCTAPFVYDNGSFDLVNGGAPTAGWSVAGCIDEFVLPDPNFGGLSFSCAQIFLSIAPPYLYPTTWELRIYDLNDVDGQGGGDGTIAGLGEFDLAVPKCLLTYSEDDGSLVTTSVWSLDFFDTVFLDGIGEVCNLEPGHYGFHVMLPGYEGQTFWQTAPQDGSECLAVWGPAVPFPFDFCQPLGPAFHNVHFNVHGGEPCELCMFDTDGDGQVGAFDLANLLGAWGACDGDECLCVDADADGQVDAFDLANLLGAWGPCR